VREEERKGSDLDSIGVVGELGIKRFQDESLLEKEGIQIISGTISIGRQEHAYMETHSALVIPGVNSIIVPRTAFSCKDPKSAKNIVKLSVFFVLSGSAHAQIDTRSQSLNSPK